MQETIVITGINGFVGEHVAREFKDAGYSVIGIGHDSTVNSKVENLLDAYISCNLLDESEVNARLNLKGIKAIIHLASLANQGDSFKEPRRYMTDNGIMTHNLLTKSGLDGMAGRIVIASTGALYDPNQPLPINESSKTYPNSPYAVGKLMAEDVTLYHRSLGLDSVIARPFNHIGPGQGEGFILPDLYQQLLSAKETGSLLVGNIKTKRDYTDVRDIARAYAKLALAQTLKHSTYNICTGTSISGETILETLQDAMDVHDITVNIDQEKIRPTDIADIVGDSARIREELNWSPQIPIEQTIKDFVASKQ